MITEATANQLRTELSTEVGRLTRCLICLVDAVQDAHELAALKISPEAREARQAVEQFSRWIQRARDE